MKKILIILYNLEFSFVKDVLTKEKYSITVYKYNKNTISRVLKEIQPDVIIVELKESELVSAQITHFIEYECEKIVPVVVVGPSENSRIIIDWIKAGAFDYVPVPFRQNDFFQILDMAFKHSKNNYIISEKDLLSDEEFRSFFGVSEHIHRILDQVKLIAPTDMSVILQGASGTGKEVIAHLIHKLSSRRKQSFIAIDCGALPEQLLESELFGYERGAFTGAYTTKPGLIEIADKSTLFLDEIGNLSYASQTKLLRFMQDHNVQRLGGHKKREVDIRIITATNIDLKEAVKNGKFRLDLFHRLNEFHINMPLLIERREDIPLLGNNFLKNAEKRLNKTIEGISPEAMDMLLAYEWPGNIRELKNVIVSAVLVADKLIKAEHLTIKQVARLDQDTQDTQDTQDSLLLFHDEKFSLKSAVRQIVNEAEKKFIIQALIASKGNRSLASKKLKITRPCLYQKIREYNIQC